MLTPPAVWNASRVPTGSGKTNTLYAAIAETIRLKQEGKPDLAAELVLTGFGKDQMDEIQQLGIDTKKE